MSVKVIHGVHHSECPLIQKIGGYCFCRANFTSKQFKDRKVRNYDNNRVVIDLVDYPQLKKFGQQNKAGKPVSPSDTIPKRKLIEVSVDFGLVPVETSSFREVQVIDSQNPKPPKRIEIRGREKPNLSKIDSVFHTVLPCSRNKSELLALQLPGGDGDSKFIPTGKQLESLNKFRVIFEPELPSMNYSDIFYVLVDSNIEIVLKCRGFSEGPSICFSENVLNFGAQYYNDETRLKFAMHNHSDTQGQFQFDNDNVRSCFQICPIQGVIQPHTIQMIEITFRAQKPQTYYKRVICLIHHQQPQFIELVGMCLPKPYFLMTPIDFCLSSDETNFLPLPTESNAELFESEHFWGIHLSKDLIDFGFHDVLLKGNFGNEASVLRASSILPYDVVIVWMQDTSGIFVITPTNSVLPSGQSILFEARFNPAFPDTFYNGQLECYIYPADRIWPATTGPPWVYYTKEQVAPAEDESQVHKARPSYLETDTKEQDDLQEGPDTKNDLSAKKIPSKLQPADELDKVVVKSPTTSLTAASVIPIPKPSKAKGQKKKKAKGAGQKVKDQEDISAVSTENTMDGHDVPEKEVTVSEFKKDLEDTVLKLNAAIPKKEKTSVFVETPGLAFPLGLTIRHSGCQVRSYSLLPQPLSELRSESSIALMADILISPSGALREANRTKPAPSLASIVSVTRDQFSKMSVFGAPSQDSNMDDANNIDMPEILAIPLCLTLQVSGHTFEKHSPVPQFFVPKNITLPPTWPLTRVFRTFIFKNTTDMPIYYNAQTIENDEIYQIKKCISVIPGNSHQIILLSMTPRNPDATKYIYNCNVLFNLKDENTISLNGITELPRLDIVINYKTNLDENEIVCTETFPGCGSNTSMQFQNTSRFHYRFSFEPMSRKHLTVFTPVPASGIIAPYETVQIVWKFTPKSESAYFLKFCLFLNCMRARNELRLCSTVYTKEITLTGIGRFCKLEAKPRRLDFGLVEIYKQKTLQFRVKNPTNTIVSVSLKIKHEQWLEFYRADQIKMEPSHFILKGNQIKTINVTVHPSSTTFQLFYIEYAIELTEVGGKDKTISTNEFKKITDISFIGDHSRLKVTDIIMYGSHPIWGLESCWNMFNIDQLNEFLLPGNSMKEGTVPVVPSVVFHFPYASVNSNSAIISILLVNSEELEGFWEIHMLPPKECATHGPNLGSKSGITDLKDNKNLLKLIWARKLTGENVKGRLSTEKHRKKRRKSSTTRSKTLSNSAAIRAMDNFKITPLKGCLKAKRSQQISFAYSYKNIGKHELCVLLRIHPGIFIWVELRGMTLADSESYAEVMHSNEMILHPVCLLDMDPPIQTLNLFNGGNVDCKFKVDTTAFEVTKQDNYGHQVFELLTSGGTIPPKSWAPIKLRFSPLEIKDYHFTFKIYSNHEFKKVKLVGSATINPTINLRPTKKSETKRKYKLLDPMVPVTLSPSQIVYDEFIPTGQKSNSILFLTNLSQSNKISYSWPVVDIDGGGFIIFLPQSGILKPKEQVTVMVTVTGGNVSTTFSRMIRCFMIDETAVAHYELLSKAWTCNRSSLLSTVSDLEADLRLLHKFGEKPEKPSSFSRLLTVKAYVGTVFGLLDTSLEKEQKSMPFSDSILQPLKSYLPGLDRKSSKLSLPPFIAQLSREIISDMLWDMINSSSFTPYVKQMSKGRAPYYYEYKESESKIRDKIKNKTTPIPHDETENPINDGRMKEKPSHFLRLPRQASEDILENIIFNLIQEAASSFRPGKLPATIKE